MHEAIHGNLFRNRRWDRWFGFLCGLPTLFQITGYRVSHLLHHRHTRTEDDPDSMMNVSNNKTFLSIFFYVAAAIGVFLYHARLPFVVLTRGTRKEVWQLVVETTITLSVVAGVFYCAWQYEFTGVVMHVWILPLLSAAIIANIRGGWAEHELTEAGHPLTQTRTVTSNPIYSFFNINLNFPHRASSLPGDSVVQLARTSPYAVAGIQSGRRLHLHSYFAFVLDAFRIGVHGKAPIDK